MVLSFYYAKQFVIGVDVVAFLSSCYYCPSSEANYSTIHSRDGNRSGRPAGWVAGRVEILRPAGQAG